MRAEAIYFKRQPEINKLQDVTAKLSVNSIVIMGDEDKNDLRRKDVIEHAARVWVF